MFPKENRASSADIANAKRRGKLLKGEIFSILVLKGDIAAPRFAVIVSTKVSKLAVTRNKIKRLVRRVARENVALFHQSSVVVFLTTRKVIEATEKQIREQMELLLLRK